MNKIISIGPPKTGSHLMANALNLVPTRPWMRSRPGVFNSHETILELIPVLGERIWCHLPYSDEVSRAVLDNYDVVLVLRRDPRDIIVSHAHYLDMVGSRASIDYPVGYSWLSDLDMSDRYNWLIRNFENIYGQFTGWFMQAGILQIHYERLIEHRSDTLKIILDYCRQAGVSTPSLPAMVYGSSVRVDSAFRRGKTGDWETEFTEVQKGFFSSVNSKLMYLWGYSDSP